MLSKFLSAAAGNAGESLLAGVLEETIIDPNSYDSATNDYFGYAVDSSATYSIVGAYGEWSTDTLNNSGAAYVYNNATGALVYTFVNPNNYSTSLNDSFGRSVAISETHAVVGAYNEGEAAGTASGVIYIYDLSDGSLLYTITNPNAYDVVTGDQFGRAVSISSSYVIAGAAGEDDAGGTSSGKAYIFDLSDGSLLYTLDNPNAYNTSATDQFGYLAVGITETHAIVGAPYEDDAGGTSSGKAYIFDLSDGSLLYTLDNPNVYDTSLNDLFGNAVAISDSYAIVGANWEDDAAGTSNGAVYVYNLSDGSLRFTVANPNPGASNYFGAVVDITDTYFASSTINIGSLATSEGVVYIFNSSTGALVHTISDPNPFYTTTGDSFGYGYSNIALASTTVTIGASNEDSNSGTNSGVAYIFDLSDASLTYTLENPDIGGQGYSGADQFGYSCDIAGSKFIVGAYNESGLTQSGSGVAYIFDSRNFSLLHTLINPNVYGTSNTDNFGRAVAMSTLYSIVGAYLEDDVLTSSGAAYIFDNSDGSLLYTLTNPNAYSTTGSDQFGWKVAINNSYAAVSANLEDDAGGTSSGVVYIFDLSDGSLAYTITNPNDYGTTASDQFGYSMSMSDSYLVVGTPNEDMVSYGATGVVYVFDTTTFSLLYTLYNPNIYSTPASDQFGWDVGVCEQFIIVGAFGEDEVGYTQSGAAYIFDAPTGTLLYTLTNPNAYDTPATDQFGYHVDISSSFAVVSTELEDDAGGTTSGVAYVFSTADGSLLYTLTNPNAYGTSANDAFGISVAVSESTLIVGASQEDPMVSGTNAGVVYVYK